MDAFKDTIMDNCVEVTNSLELLINEIKNDRHELAQTLTTDENVNAYAVVERCNKLNSMINIAKTLMEIFERRNLEFLKHRSNKIAELYCFVEAEYPAYKELMISIKYVYSNLIEVTEKIRKRKYTFDIEELLSNDLKKYDTASSIAMDIVLNKKLLKKDSEDSETPASDIIRRKEKIEELEFIFKFIASIPDKN